MLMANSNKAQKISVNLLKYQGLTTVKVGTHVSIRPMTDAELEKWATTREEVRGGADTHFNTKKVQNSVVEEVYK